MDALIIKRLQVNPQVLKRRTICFLWQMAFRTIRRRNVINLKGMSKLTNERRLALIVSSGVFLALASLSVLIFGESGGFMKQRHHPHHHPLKCL